MAKTIKLREIGINLGVISVKFQIDELDQTFTAILEEMRLITKELSGPERELLRKIMATSNGTLTVKDLYPDFTRESADHKTLRLLRNAQFIRPSEGSRWEANKHIQVKPFGKLMWEKVGEDKLFPE